MNKMIDNVIILTEMGYYNEPLYYQIPAAFCEVNGEKRIERIIEGFLKDKIENIYVVAAYRKELYFYLEKKYPVKLLDYQFSERESTYFLYTIKDMLKRTCICTSAIYFSVSSIMEYISELSLQGRRSFINDEGTFCYFTLDLSKNLNRLLEIQKTEEKSNFLCIKDFINTNRDVLPIAILKTDSCFIPKIRAELKNLFVSHIAEAIEKKVMHILDGFPQRDKLNSVEILKNGNTNMSIKFCFQNKLYVFRYPGVTATAFVERKKEVFFQNLSYKLGIDKSCIYIDEEGNKLSCYIEECIPFDYFNPTHLDKLFKSLKKLHQVSADNDFTFDVMQEADKLLEIANKKKGYLNTLFQELRDKIVKLFKYTEADRFRKTVCHNDMHAGNFLITKKGEFFLIDWEFAGIGDPAYDLGCMISYEKFSSDFVEKILRIYFERELTFEEKRHYYAYIAISGWYYLCWCQYKESMNETPLFNMVNRFESIIYYLDKSLKMYEN